MPIPNQTKTHSDWSASPTVVDNANMATTSGPQQGSAIGPKSRPYV